ncbi:MAG: hypothetical protein II776_02030 [Clostridia bacterium]|nr:hypothetical protein [Clostridia bacterium]
MKKKLCFVLAIFLLTAVLAGCGAADPGAPAGDPTGAITAESESKTELEPAATGGAAGKGEAKDFTAKVRLESDFVEFCLPADHDGGFFSDMGANCMLALDRYGDDVVAYHEYDRYGGIEKKTVGDYTFDFQKFHNMDIPDWTVYVIRIVHNHEYYRFVYNVYAADYDDGQVEKFMETIRFFS